MTCNCATAEQGREVTAPSALLTLTADDTGSTPAFRLPAGRWWAVLGSGPVAAHYDVFVQWGDRSVFVQSVANGGRSEPLPCFPDAFVVIKNASPNANLLLAVAG
jgi:hypothetical protein